MKLFLIGLCSSALLTTLFLSPKSDAHIKCPVRTFWGSTEDLCPHIHDNPLNELDITSKQVRGRRYADIAGPAMKAAYIKTVKDNGSPRPLTQWQKQVLSYDFPQSLLEQIRINYNANLHNEISAGGRRVHLFGNLGGASFCNRIFLQEPFSPKNPRLLLTIGHEIMHSAQCSGKSIGKWSWVYQYEFFMADFSYEKNIFEAQAFEYERKLDSELSERLSSIELSEDSEQLLAQTNTIRNNALQGDFKGSGQRSQAVFIDRGNSRMVIEVDGRTWFDSGEGSFTYSRTFGSCVSGDFNGDKKSDIACLYDYGNRDVGAIVFVSRGDNFKAGLWWRSGKNNLNPGNIQGKPAVIRGESGKNNIRFTYIYPEGIGSITLVSTGSKFNVVVER